MCGTIAKHAFLGDRVGVVFLTDGVGARFGTGSQERTERRTAATKALELLGVEETFQFDLPDNKLDSVPLLDIVNCIENVVSVWSPSVVYPLLWRLEYRS